MMRWISGVVIAVMATAGVGTGATMAGQNPPVRFTDATAHAGIDFVQTIGDTEMTNIVESAGVGCAFLDYDGDGWMDIYFVNGHWLAGLSDPQLDADQRSALAAATDHLYRNRGDGTFEDVTVRAGVALKGYGMGVVSADYDADGDLDIYITNYGPNFLFRNNADGTFTEIARLAGIDVPDFSVGAVFFDYDRDGRLDLYVGNYLDYDPQYQYFYAPDGFPGPLAYAGQQDRLFHGNKDGTFTDVTRRAGIQIEPKGRAMGIGAFDFDGDAFMDVFVANDAMENFLFRNNADGTFVNQALERGVAYGENGDATAAMGVEIFDHDGDARFDMFVPDMAFSCLYRNTGAGLFEDHTVRAGIAPVMGQYAGWGTAIADFDLDGQLDLYISNGDVHHLEPQEDVVLLGKPNGRFIDVSESAGACMRQKFVSRGLAAADYDNDGDIDLLVTNLNDRPNLLRNDTPRRGRHWLAVRLVGRSDNPDAIGAIVTVTLANRTLTRQRLSAASYLSQHDSRLHFGLADHATIRRLEVVWPDGTKQVVENAPADQLLTITQPKRREKNTP